MVRHDPIIIKGATAGVHGFFRHVADRGDRIDHPGVCCSALQTDSHSEDRCGSTSIEWAIDFESALTSASDITLHRTR